MKKIKNKISFIMFLTFIMSGCGSVSNKTELPTSILWEVRPKSDTSKVAYLLGSIHIAPPELYPLNSVIMDAWNKSNALAVEINILDFNATSIMSDVSLITRFISLTNKLSDKLPDSLYVKVKNILIKNGIPEETIDNFTPLGASILLQLGDVSSLLFNKDSNSVEGIDMYFLKKAKAEDKPIYEIESISIQIKALETLNENIIPYLQTLVDELDNSKDSDINKLFTAWKNGDVKVIEEMMNAPFTADKEINERITNALLYNRNIDMTAKIEKYLLEKETYFVVLGAGHYVGNKSIVDILQKSGKYNIKRL
jgi:uncharacterized protein YbaP (TraB family)